MDVDIVDILDSDEEEAPSQTSTTASDSSSSKLATKIPPRNRPGPLSMKLKLGVPIEADPEPNPVETPNKPESPAPGDPEDYRKQNKILTKLVDPHSKFLEDFDPEHSIRERRKMVRKTTGPTTTTYARPGTLYDEYGNHRETGFDLCDCLDMTCPGCHFKCPSCGSNKCGQNCRVNRKFMYESILFDGKDTEIKNPLLKR